MDRGREFKAEVINNALEIFNINCFLSAKGKPHDNVVAVRLFMIEFKQGEKFYRLEYPSLHFNDYVNYFSLTKFG